MRFAKHTPKTLGWSSSHGPGDWVYLFNKIPGKVQGKDRIQQALTKRNKKKKKKIGLSVSDFGMTVIKRICHHTPSFSKDTQAFCLSLCRSKCTADNVQSVVVWTWFYGRLFLKTNLFLPVYHYSRHDQHGKISTTLKARPVFNPLPNRLIK